jgi:hypothetical protein
MGSTQATEFDAARCPICGELNECATAADPNATECWCESVKFPHNLLDGLPEGALGRVCICRRCIENHHRENPG